MLSAPAPTTVSPVAVHRWRALVALYAILLTALVGRVVFTAWEPPFDGTIRYDEIRPIVDAYWPMNLYLGGPAYLVGFVATAVFVVFLARGRTAVVTLVGAALVGLGGTVFALVITAETLPFAYAADPAVLPEAEGRALFDVLNAHLGLLLPALVGGMAAVAFGVLLVLVAAGISRALPRWFVVVGLVYLVLFVVLPPDPPRPVAMAMYLVEVAFLAGLGWFGRRAARAE